MEEITLKSLFLFRNWEFLCEIFYINYKNLLMSKVHSCLVCRMLRL